ncbi:sodium/hydrogen exchanger 9B1 isoform X2 [Mastomys coucha]|uniref:sodium/hydrogen exchanger 9B1 isoform X2 n=1 Tax=Mastomys coucha TaxID=35658 RepID=UPI00126151A1|nr:sodium/hydrogen exchanger 9B1 isoform X2 [Mastomys coucha]
MSNHNTESDKKDDHFQSSITVQMSKGPEETMKPEPEPEPEPKESERKETQITEIKRKEPEWKEMKKEKRSTNTYCPPRGTINKTITDGVALIVLWTLLWALRGMLLAGFTIRNVPIIYEFVHIPTTWSSTLRNTALTIILIRAGLGLDPQALKHLKGVCLRLSFGPCLLEACSAALFSHFIMNFPWQWGFLLGLMGALTGAEKSVVIKKRPASLKCKLSTQKLWSREGQGCISLQTASLGNIFVLGAVSPAVVVPNMLTLQENGYGVEKGIPTLLVAASSMDDIVAITGFNTFLSIVFSSGSVISNILSSLRDVLIGVLVGIVMGIFVQYFPSGDQERLTQRRAFLVLSICISAVLGCQHIGLHGSGGLVTLVLSFMAAKRWAGEKVGIQKIVANTWNVFQPLLFGLVGTEVSVESLESKTIGMCIATLGLALSVRILSTFVLMSFANFRFKEKVFIALSWIPKATVQAVLGPLALETARVMAPHLEGYSKNVMTVAFLAILITAPNGALIIGLLGPKILEHSEVTFPLKVELSNFHQ